MNEPPPGAPAEPVARRRGYILAAIDTRHQRGLEIGALCRPVVRPGEGPIVYADHLDTAGLRAKYANDPNVDGAAIVPVSYVLDGRPLAEVVAERRFEYVIASHVIEHLPNPVRWLKEVAAILEEGGVLSLVIPDKRYTFDCRRENTRPADWLAAYYDDRQRPSFVEVLDHVTETTAADTAALWRDREVPLPPLHPGIIASLNDDTLRHYHRELADGLGLDVHCHVFTPTSFFRILHRLIEFGVFDYRVVAFFPTPPGELEFFVSLQRMPGEMLAAQRREAQLASIPPASAHDHPTASDAAPGISGRTAARLFLAALRRRYRRGG
jgi:hypothetical protein